MPQPPIKRLSKSTLSMYLRTACDRELYLSLHTDTELEKAGLPEALKARPGIGVLRDAGIEFEELRNGQLNKAFGKSVICDLDGKGKTTTGDLAELLKRLGNLPQLVLQTKFEPLAFQAAVLANIGVAADKIKFIPPMAGCIPDVLVIRTPEVTDQEVLVSGLRKQIDYSREKRMAISIIDIKHTSEANPSYSAEIALYALMLSNWLTVSGLENEFFVTDRSYLWTRFQQGNSQLEKDLAAGGAQPPQVLESLISDCEDANLRFYMPAVMRFFREDIPRAVQIGDQNWRNLEWHVDSRCSACDWLGLEKWAGAVDRAKIKANPEHYCLPSAAIVQHLSRIAGMTRGARKTLEFNAVTDTTKVAGTTGAEPVYKLHSLLKREKAKLPARAVALHSGATTTDISAILATLSAFPNLQAHATVNFDASAGLLTGLGLTGRVTVAGQKALQLTSRTFVVDQKTLDGEWVALESFLSQLADYIERGSRFAQTGGVAKLRGQIAFWEKRQFDELCAAMGRHLPKVLALTDRKAKSLAWMFPAEELLEKDEGAISPCIVFIEDIIRRVVFAPTPHVTTLFETVEHYHFEDYKPVVGDPYYREYLSNGIPRERIYEIWGGTPTVQRGSVSLPRTTIVTEFANALLTQCRALDTVVLRLRKDFKGQLRTTAPVIDVTIPRGAANVAFDGKLWIWWDELEHATARMAAYERLALDVDTLEASYHAIRLTKQIDILANGHRLFSASAESAESKLDSEDSFLAVGLIAEPGFPLEYIRQRIPPGAPAYPANPHLPFYTTLKATLVNYDRATDVAEVMFEDDGTLLNYMDANHGISFTEGLFLTEGMPFFNWAWRSRDILGIIGNPSIATPDPNAARAMALPAQPPGTSQSTPVAEVLWNAGAVHKRELRSEAQAKEIAEYARARTQLNESQVQAVQHSAQLGLTVIWGPPGTGKTKTLAGLIHALTHSAASNSSPLKILIAAPTYKAIEEILGRVVRTLDSDASCPCTIFIGYSRNRIPGKFSIEGKHLSVDSFNFTNPNAQEWQICNASLADKSRVTIVATTVHQAYKLADFSTGNNLAPLFDFVILDESSQIPVTKALSPLATLKPGAQLIVAGDHLQMPPISPLEAPVGCEYLVGSFQKYLRDRFKGDVLTCDLIENYRSAEDLVEYAKTLSYPTALKAHFPGTKLFMLSEFPTPQTGYPKYLPYSPAWNEILHPTRIAVSVLHDDELSSQGNVFEAEIVAGLLFCLRQSISAELDGRGDVEHRTPLSEEFWRRSVGIVTPHRAQRALIVRELKKVFSKDSPNLIDAAVDTVEKFQGGERQTIIVSFGVGDADVIAGEEEFLMQLERTNVAISRAMAKCIVIMPTTLAGHIPQDKRALLTAHAIKGYVDEFCKSATAITIQSVRGERRGQLRWHQK
jgi:hypothetical protein